MRSTIHHTNQKESIPISVSVKDNYGNVVASGNYTTAGTYNLSFTPASAGANYTLEFHMTKASAFCFFRVDDVLVSYDDTTTVTVCKEVEDGYRYGFNSQEKVDEVSGKGNSYTAEFWQYDSRLGRRWNLDPKPNISISGYATFANSPILFSDPLGDTLDIGNNEESKKDIMSLTSEENQKYLTFNNNRVGVDFGNMDDQTKSDVLKNDEGLSLLNDLILSDKKFLYEASDISLIRSENGDKAAGLTYPLTSNIINASEYGKDSNDGRRHRPKAGYDGHVIIHPNAQYLEQNAMGYVVSKSRASIVFHELEENYERTHNGIDYNGKNGAHNLAIKREGKWEGKSRSPGEIFGIIKAEKPSQSRRKEISKTILEYMAE